jgi:hypothetical protein
MINQFVTFSAEITAFPELELWSTGLARVYLDTVTSIVGAHTLAELIDAYTPIQDVDRESRDRKLRRAIFGHQKLGPISRNIIKLWYIGIWEQLPQAWTEAYGAIEKNVGFSASNIAYTEGLLFKAIGANPPGAKAPGYGSWALPPQIPTF